MAKFEIVFKRSVAKDLRRIPNKDVKRILERVDELQHDPTPHSAERLTSTDFYRIRQGVYRILYEIKQQEITVIIVKVGHRREVYRGI